MKFILSSLNHTYQSPHQKFFSEAISIILHYENNYLSISQLDCYFKISTTVSFISSGETTVSCKVGASNKRWTVSGSLTLIFS